MAIDTSCDDTSIAVLEVKNKKFKVLSNIVSSQVKLHQKYGGVYPSLAKREHQKNLPLVLKKALRQVPGTHLVRTRYIAVTVGPGLEPCLWQGINFAKKLAEKWGALIIPVNHIEAHLLINFIEQRPKLPAIALIVSGGHTQLILVKDIGKYKIIGETRDDAAGECFDKTARILGLPYPGGPAIAAEANKLRIKDKKSGIKLPKPMLYSKDYDFSFSGLKTAVLYAWKKQPKKIRKSKKYTRQMAKEIQQAIIDVLIKKTIRATKDFRAKTIILGGGVAANKELRKQLQKKIKKEIPNALFLIPNSNLCTDNALMIAITAYFHQKQATQKYYKIQAKANLRL